MDLQGPSAADWLVRIRQWAGALGFSQIGVADVDLSSAEPGLLAWLDAGFRDVFAAPGLKLAEWPDKVAGLLPTPDLRLDLQPGDDDRRDVLVQVLTPAGRALLG